MLQEKIGTRQLAILVLHFMLGTSILIAPSSLAHVAKQDGWLSAIIGIMLVAGSVLIYNPLIKRYPALTFTQCIETILGRWIGKAIAILLFCYFFLLTSFLIRVAGNFIVAQMMPETPIELVHLVLVIVVMIAVAYGIETIARASELMFIPVLFLFLLLVVFLLPEIKVSNLFPVMEHGYKPIALSSFYLFSIQEIVVFLMLMPNVSKPDQTKPMLIKGVLVGGSVIFLTTLLCLLVLGAGLTERNIFASYSLAKKITVANFMRVDAFMAIIWLIALFFKTAICYYGASLSLSQTLGIGRYRVLILPLGLLVMWLSIIVYSNIVEFLNFTPTVWSLFSVCFVILLPVLLLIIDRMRFGSQPGGEQQGTKPAAPTQQSSGQPADQATAGQEGQPDSHAIRVAQGTRGVQGARLNQAGQPNQAIQAAQVAGIMQEQQVQQAKSAQPSESAAASTLTTKKAEGFYRNETTTNKPTDENPSPA